MQGEIYDLKFSDREYRWFAGIAQSYVILEKCMSLRKGAYRAGKIWSVSI